MFERALYPRLEDFDNKLLVQVWRRHKKKLKKKKFKINNKSAIEFP